MFRAFIRKDSVKRYTKSIVRKANSMKYMDYQQSFLQLIYEEINYSNLLLLLMTSDMSKFALELLRKM